MAEGDVGWWGLAASLLLIAVTVAISMWRRLGLERDVLIATGSGARPVARRRLRARRRHRPRPADRLRVGVARLHGRLRGVDRVPPRPGGARASSGSPPLALGTSTAVTVAVIFGLGIFPVEARAIVPVGGMMVGNAMTSTVVAGRRIVAEFSEKRADVEARLALGQPWQEASRASLRSALRTGLTSQIETTKAVGLVFLPGAMTGLILAGVDPVDAVRVQAAIMFLILGAVAINVVVIGTGVTSRLFTDDHRLVRVARPPD